MEASAGIGKTSIIETIAQERNMGYTMISLSQLEEAGDLIGFPLKEYECQVGRKVVVDGKETIQVSPKTVWLNEKQIDSPSKGVMYRQTGKTRMSYAKPAWVPEYNENGNIVCLDDFSRASQQLLQATMEIVRAQKYVSWTLPKKTTICLTSNSDDGTNNVNSLDEAQMTRFINFNVGWDKDLWCQWAEKNDIDGRCINFIMTYSDELFRADEEGNRICNPRSFTMFSNMISGIKDWDTKDSLSFITTISKGCFKDDNGRFSQMFNAFLMNKMHLLIQPKKVLMGDWKEVQGILDSTVYDSDGHYRPDIAAILERRFTNFVSAWLDSKEQTPIAKVKTRILELLQSEEKGGRTIFTKDMFYHMIKNITADHKNQTNQLLHEPKIAAALS